MLTKSDFLKYSQCYKYLWLHKYRKDLLPALSEATQRVFDEGYDVESYAYKLFPGGVDAGACDFNDAPALTKKYIKDGRKIIYQPTVTDGKLFCRADIIKFNPRTKLWDIYEVKNSTKVKDVHLLDLAFQKICFTQSKIKIGRLFIIHVNNQYVRQGEIDPKKLLVKADVTSDVQALIKSVKLDIQKAHQVLDLKKEPLVKILRQCGDPYSCAFIDYCWQHIPENSIYNIAGGLRGDRLEQLLDQGIIKIKDIPPAHLTSKLNLRHYNSIKSKQVYIDKTAIKKELANLKYPLYFLDYETNNPAVPMFDNYRPHQVMTFQFSLHVIRTPKSKVEHYEHLATKYEDPSLGLVKALKKYIGPTGSVIVWNQSFEKTRNKELALRHPQYANFLKKVNDRVYDLIIPFRKGYYVHKDFHASASIKDILPVMVPKLSYKKLNIQEGGTASASWLTLIDPKLDNKTRNKLNKDMLAYCQLDTLAMVEILKVLQKVK